jgi:hypothetical protein
VNGSTHVPDPLAHWLVAVSHATPCAQSAVDVQLCLQSPVVASHAYGAHALLVAGAHVPEPSQVDAGVETAPLHEAIPHGVPAAGKWHACVSLPSHFPMHAPEPGHTGWPYIEGSPVMGTQLPAFAPTLHAWHCPPHA